jgi:hypothetical protein
MLSGTAEFNTLVEDMFKSLSYTVWIAKDTKQLKKLKMFIDMEMTAEQAGALASDFDTMDMEITVDMSLKDYDKPVSIDLPDEAEDAVEI